MLRTTAAIAVVWLALLSPNQSSAFGPSAFVRIPIEGLLLVALLLLLRGRARRLFAGIAGATLGVLVILKGFDLGFYAALDHPFNPLADWGSFGPAFGLIRDSTGPAIAIGAIVLIGVLIPAILAITIWAMFRLERVTADHRIATTRTILALGVVWLLSAATGLQFVSGTPVASASATNLVVGRVHDVREELHDSEAFAGAIATDPYDDTSSADLVSELKGKDVLLVFIESYGRSALEGSSFSPAIKETLASGTERLAAAGYDSRSAFMTSPAFGAGSWLAHASVQSGLWVENQSRYDQLITEDRRTLTSTFRDAGWRTVYDVPANTRDWPDGESFYGFDQLYDSRNVGYQGPKFGYAPMPDQYTLSTFCDRELAPTDRAPVMAEIDLISSHAPWTPVPEMVDPDIVGDGSIYAGMPERGETRDEVWGSSEGVQASYAATVEYSLNSLFTFAETCRNDDLVMVVLGDHQPARIVSGEEADHDVPVSIIANDPAVMNATAAWGWQDGIAPDPNAPVWRMDEFRDRFFSSFGSGLPGE